MCKINRLIYLLEMMYQNTAV